MKILYISTSDLNDFMGDMVFHGLRSLLGSDVVDPIPMSRMYKTHKLTTDHMHGRGFNSTCLLDDLETDRTDIVNKIASRYFDLVIYGAVDRERGLLPAVLDHYPANRIIFIDGHDKAPNARPELVDKGIYFKREKEDNWANTFPISFSIPKELIALKCNMPKKTRYHMSLIPGNIATYEFPRQWDYNTAYQQAIFGFTWKKAGWDCFRHYEILMNGCLPIFLDAFHIPENVMTTYPKEKVKSILTDGFFTIEGYNPLMEFEYNVYNTITNVKLETIHFNNSKLTQADELIDYFLEYTRQNLTTERTAQYVLDIAKKLG